MPAAPDPRSLEIFERLCGDCHKPIFWTKTVASGGLDWMPVDAAPVLGGNVIVYPDPKAPRRILSDVIGKGLVRAGMAADGWRFHQHHRLSCPRADHWARQPVHKRPKPTGIAPAPAEPATVSTPPDEGTLW